MSVVRDKFVMDPPSTEIAARLTAARVDVCEHGRNPCILRCGVHWIPGLGRGWEPIPQARRLEWLERMERPS